MQQGEKLFIVDLTTVSFFDSKTLKNIASSNVYKKTPFLYLVSSYMKNSAIASAGNRLKLVDKKTSYDWDIYMFIKQ